MKNTLCLTIAVLLLLVFSAVNLFLPYALLAVGLFVGLAATCGFIKRRTRSAACPLGFC